MKHHPADILISPQLGGCSQYNTHDILHSYLGFLSQATGLSHTKLDQPLVFIFFVHWVDRTVKRVTNGSVVTHKNGLVRCSPHALGFYQEQ